MIENAIVASLNHISSRFDYNPFEKFLLTASDMNDIFYHRNNPLENIFALSIFSLVDDHNKPSTHID